MAALIGLTATSLSGSSGGFGVRPPTFVVSQDYCNAVAQAGAIPVLLPFDVEIIDELLPRLSGVLFTGGVDFNPSLYGESPHPLLGDLDLDRDKFEMALFEKVFHHTDLPILGVCRGFQLFNVGLGGTLWQDLPSQRPSHVHHSQRDHRYKAVHPLKVDGESTMGKLLSKVIAVNSLHHQGIKDLAKGLKPVAWSPDGLIEAVEAEDHPCRFAAQWHPENMVHTYPEFIHLFNHLVESARARKQGQAMRGAVPA